MFVGDNMANISKSLYCNYVQCKKMIWLEKNKPKEKNDLGNDSVLENGTEVGDLARSYFGKYSLVKFDEVLLNMIMETKKYLKEKSSIICEASFKYNNLFASVDILKNDEDGVSIYEVKSSTELKDIYIHDASFQAYILRNLGYKIKSVNVMYLNKDYIFKDKLDLKGLFIIEDVTSESIMLEKNIKDNIDKINNILDNKKEPNIDIDLYCFKPYDCPFFKYCTKDLPCKNVFDIRGLTINKKFDLYKKGIISFSDLFNEDLNPKYIEQIDYDINNKPAKIEKEKIEEFMNTLTNPLYFLDFETYQDAIPKYNGQAVYEQVPFQYSLHYYENNILEHKEYLSEINIDPRRKLAEELVKDIPNNVTVLAYNMSFEKNVIKNLANLYPDLSVHLMKIHSNIKDLMVPFYKRYYYVKEMEGSYSIKKVLPALFPNEKKLDYHNLEMVHNGGEAMSIFKELSKYSKEDQDKIRHNLLKYCELDTYAMVKIYEKLKSLYS